MSDMSQDINVIFFGFRTHRILFAMHVGVDTMTSFKS